MRARQTRKLCIHFMAVLSFALVQMIFSVPVLAASVSVVGLFKDKAIVSINGSSPRMMATGQQVQSVKLVSANSDSAVFEVDGKRRSLGMGQSFSPSAGAAGRPTVVLAADGRGHFASIGSINGHSVQFLVDTGATSVAMSANDARRMGVDYKSGQMTGVSTANGVIPAWRVSLNSVQLGGITLYGVEGLVLETHMPVALLGMSFLNRTDMKREGQTLTLTLRY